MVPGNTREAKGKLNMYCFNHSLSQISSNIVFFFFFRFSRINFGVAPCQDIMRWNQITFGQERVTYNMHQLLHIVIELMAKSSVTTVTHR